ncbi:putative signal peptide-containing protein [Cryptosporidium canis]|uniref:Signal peptide-containing protein n=1 Tax=Cryptosporidium canis TaxID=195482 RepID=A0A9D5HXZ7_9CRYT|nr:putative signal peptide-containing protein [Cryptosporidium canis]
MIGANLSRAGVGMRALLGCIFLIFGLLTSMDNSWRVVAVSSSESYLSQNQYENSSGMSTADSIVGDEETVHSTGSMAESSGSAVNSENSDDAYDSSVYKSSSDQAPEGASLYNEDTSIYTESSPDGLPSRSNTTSPEEFLEYGYNNIHDSSVDARSADSEGDRPEYSDPAVMESVENSPKSKIDSSKSLNEALEGDTLEELDTIYKNMKAQGQLLEPFTENIDVTSSPLRTPKTDSVSEATHEEAHAVHADSHMESPPKSPDDFVMNDYEIKVEVNPVEQIEASQDMNGSEVMFEDTSESQLPVFGTKEGIELIPGEESSKLTSGISEASESSAGNIIDVESSGLLSQREDLATRSEDKDDISGSADISSKMQGYYRPHSPNLGKQSKPSEFGVSRAGASFPESSFVNPNTEDISMESSESNADTMGESGHAQPSFQEPSKTDSASVEPPSPPSSAIEENTVGNKRVYSGPYVRTSATAGKVSPRIASVINSLVGQFERFNLYGAGSKDGEGAGSREKQISNKLVSSIKSNFDGGVNNFSDFVPQNSQEEELVEALKKESPKNTFLFKNRYEEMKSTQNSSGKTLLQEEIEKIRGNYRNNLSRQFSTGKVWKRPSMPTANSPPILTGFSGIEFIEKVKMINPNFNQDKSASEAAGETRELDHSVKMEKSESLDDAHYVPSSSPLKQEASIGSARSIAESDIEKTQETEREAEDTTNDGESDIEPFSRVLASKFEDFDLDVNCENQPQSEGSTNEGSPQTTLASEDQFKANGFGNAPFSYINTVKELPSGVKPQDVPETHVPDAILSRRDHLDRAQGQSPDIEAQGTDDHGDYLHDQDLSISYSKHVELSPEQEREIAVCYNKAKKIKTVNFGLELTESPSSVVTEAFINEFTKYKAKIKELILFGQEAQRVAEKYIKKRSWRKKTKKFKLEFLELSNEFTQHSKAIRSLLHHLMQVTNPNIMEILQQIITGHTHSKQTLLVQCKILYQAFYSYRNSVRSRLLKKISESNFLDVLHEQIKVYLEQRFHPIVKAIQSNKYLKKKLGKHIPDVSILTNIDKYQELSYAGEGEKVASKKGKGNKFARFFRRLFKRPCFKCLKTKKQPKKKKSSSDKV